MGARRASARYTGLADFFEPLTLFGPAIAYWAWAGFNLLCLGAALFLLIREIGPPGVDGWTVGALMLLYPPIAINFWFAQSEVVLLLIFVLSLRALRRRNDATAGVLLAGAALLRAYPLGMLGYLVARRNWRAAGYFLAACAIGVAFAVVTAGVQPVASFLRLASPISGTLIGGAPAGLLRHPANLNLGSFVQFVSAIAAGPAPPGWRSNCCWQASRLSPPPPSRMTVTGRDAAAVAGAS